MVVLDEEALRLGTPLIVVLNEEPCRLCGVAHGGQRRRARTLAGARPR